MVMTTLLANYSYCPQFGDGEPDNKEPENLPKVALSSRLPYLSSAEVV